MNVPHLSSQMPLDGFLCMITMTNDKNDLCERPHVDAKELL